MHRTESALRLQSVRYDWTWCHCTVNQVLPAKGLCLIWIRRLLCGETQQVCNISIKAAGAVSQSEASIVSNCAENRPLVECD